MQINIMHIGTLYFYYTAEGHISMYTGTRTLRRQVQPTYRCFVSAARRQQHRCR